MAVFLGLAVAATYGAADFCGGLASKRAPAWAVVLAAQCVGLGLVAGAVALDPGASPTGGDLAYGAAASCVGVGGVVLLYFALARGPMGVVAPVTAVGSSVVPVVWGLATGERPGAIALGGIAVSFVAVALISREREEHPARAARSTLAAAVAAGIAFGAVFVLLDNTGDDSGFWPLLSGRAASTAALVLVLVLLRRPLLPRTSNARLVVAAGVFDVGANALFLLAVREGLLSLVAVLGSLYPVATVLLARVVLDERLARHQLAGLALALVGVTMIAAP
jgi:drug/metabolite transporter (DMT)-like permease